VDRLLPELAGRKVLKPLDDTVPANRPIIVRDLLTFRLASGSSWRRRTPIRSKRP
jgi:hypothetical protein